VPVQIDLHQEFDQHRRFVHAHIRRTGRPGR
jgi:hypothetical protein